MPTFVSKRKFSPPIKEVQRPATTVKDAIAKREAAPQTTSAPPSTTPGVAVYGCLNDT